MLNVGSGSLLKPDFVLQTTEGANITQLFPADQSGLYRKCGIQVYAERADHTCQSKSGPCFIGISGIGANTNNSTLLIGWAHLEGVVSVAAMPLSKI